MAALFVGHFAVAESVWSVTLLGVVVLLVDHELSPKELGVMVVAESTMTTSGATFVPELTAIVGCNDVN